MVVLAVAVSACGGDGSLRRFTPPDADERSRAYLSLFVRDQGDSALARLVVPLRTSEATAELRKIADIMRNERFDTVRVIGGATNVVGQLAAGRG